MVTGAGFGVGLRVGLVVGVAVATGAATALSGGVVISVAVSVSVDVVIPRSVAVRISRGADTRVSSATRAISLIAEDMVAGGGRTDGSTGGGDDDGLISVRAGAGSIKASVGHKASVDISNDLRLKGDIVIDCEETVGHKVLVEILNDFKLKGDVVIDPGIRGRATPGDFLASETLSTSSWAVSVVRDKRGGFDFALRLILCRRRGVFLDTSRFDDCWTETLSAPSGELVCDADRSAVAASVPGPDVSQQPSRPAKQAPRSRENVWHL